MKTKIFLILLITTNILAYNVTINTEFYENYGNSSPIFFTIYENQEIPLSIIYCYLGPLNINCIQSQRITTYTILNNKLQTPINFSIDNPGTYYICGAIDINNNWHCDKEEPFGIKEIYINDNLEINLKISKDSNWNNNYWSLSQPPRCFTTNNSCKIKFDIDTPTTCFLSINNNTYILNQSTNQSILIENLYPNTKYNYNIYNDLGQLIYNGYFRTSFESDENFSFAFFGDSMAGPFTLRSISNNISPKNPDFIIHLGDIVFDKSPKCFLNQQNQYCGNYKMLDNVLNKSIYYPVRGNHDRFYDKYMSNHSIIGDSYYSFRYGKVGFVVADWFGIYEEFDINRLNWIDNELKEMRSKVKWLFFVQHNPVFILNSNSNNELTEILVRNKVDCILSGHFHCYQKTYKYNMIQIISGGAGSELLPINNTQIGQDIISKYHYVFARYYNGKIEFNVYDINDNIIDTFRLEEKEYCDAKNWDKYE